MAGSSQSSSADGSRIRSHRQGRAVKALTIVEDASHEAGAIKAKRTTFDRSEARVLDRLALTGGLPHVILTDVGKGSGETKVAWIKERTSRV